MADQGYRPRCAFPAEEAIPKGTYRGSRTPLFAQEHEPPAM